MYDLAQTHLWKHTINVTLSENGHIYIYIYSNFHIDMFCKMESIALYPNQYSTCEFWGLF